MKIIAYRFLVALGAAARLPAIASPAFAYTGQNLAHEAKISIDQARSIALKAHAGKITDEELERESGGSGLRYSFDIKHGRVTQEVGVDAATGANSDPIRPPIPISFRPPFRFEAGHRSEMKPAT